MSEAQTAHSRARRMNLIDRSLLVRFRPSQGMFSGRCAPENAGHHLDQKPPGFWDQRACPCWVFFSIAFDSASLTNEFILCPLF